MIGIGINLWRRGGGGIETYLPEYYHTTNSGTVTEAGLHSSAATADGISNSATTPTTQTFGVNGMDPGAATALRYDYANPAVTSLLKVGMRVAFTVEAGAALITTTVSPAKYFQCNSGAGYLTKHTDGNLRNEWPVASGTRPFYGAYPTGKGSKIKVELMHNGAHSLLFVDGLPMGRDISAISITDANCASSYIGGLTTSAGTYPAGYAVENYSVNSTPFTYTAHPDISTYKIFGDSIVIQGAPALTWIGTGVYSPWHPGYGFQSDGTTAAAAGSFGGDSGVICELSRQLIAGGYAPANTPGTNNQAVTASTFAGVLTRVNAQVSVPKLCFVVAGTQDVIAGRTASAIQADLEAIVDGLVAKGATHIVMTIPPYIGNRPAYDNINNQTLHSEMNAVIAGMINYHISVTVVDLFSYFGQFFVDSAYFQSGSEMPNAAGSTLIGKLIGEAAVQRLTTGVRPTISI